MASIGRCECINSPDKNSITNLIVDELDRISNSIKRIENSNRELREFGAKPEELLRRYELRQTELGNLLGRIKETPTCK